MGCCPFENDAVHVDDEEEDYIPEKPVADSNLDGSEPNHELPFFQNKAALGCLKILTIGKSACPLSIFRIYVISLMNKDNVLMNNLALANCIHS